MKGSLHPRFIVASVLWTAGLVLLLHATTIQLLHKYPALRIRGVTHRVLLILAAVVLMVIGFRFMRQNLEVLRSIGPRLAALRRGEAQRLEGTYPTEVAPLIDDLNLLLEERGKAIERAQAVAGDLAHGLKTPLAVMSHEADRLAAQSPALAAEIHLQIQSMRRQIDHHLARSRAAAAGQTAGTICAVADCVAALVRTMQKVYADKALAIELTLPEALEVRCRPSDLEEMIGNLLDNACKWSEGLVSITAMTDGDRAVIQIDDDGPGIDPSQRERVLRRGLRADEAMPGSGLGLAITRDVADLYGGTLSLTEPPQGGTRATLTLPSK